MYWTTFEKSYSDLTYTNPSVAVGDLIYSFSCKFCGNVPYINTNTLEWSFLLAHSVYGAGLEPEERFGHTVVAYDEKVYLWGGSWGLSGVGNTLYCFDTKTLSWSRPQVTGIIPSARYYHSACISNAECKMYILGGFDVNTNQLLRDVHCLDLKTMNWSNIITTGEIPPRQLYLTAVVDNRMYIHGGYDNIKHTFSTDTMYLDLESNQWHCPEITGNIPVGPNDRSLFVHNNIIYVFGSCTGPNYRNLNDLYYLDTKRNHWNLIHPRGRSPEERDEQACVVVGDKMFLLGQSLDSEDEDEEYVYSKRYYNNTIHVLDFNPSLETLAKITIVENGLDTSCLPTELRLAFKDEDPDEDIDEVTDEDIDEDTDEDSDEDSDGVTDEYALC